MIPPPYHVVFFFFFSLVYHCGDGRMPSRPVPVLKKTFFFFSLCRERKTNEKKKQRRPSSVHAGFHESLPPGDDGGILLKQYRTASVRRGIEHAWRWRRDDDGPSSAGGFDPRQRGSRRWGVRRPLFVCAAEEMRRKTTVAKSSDPVETRISLISTWIPYYVYRVFKWRS